MLSYRIVAIQLVSFCNSVMSFSQFETMERSAVLFFSARQMDVHGRIREVLAETIKHDQGSARWPLSEGDFVRALQRRGIIDDVMRDLHFTQVCHRFADCVRLRLTFKDVCFTFLTC